MRDEEILIATLLEDACLTLQQLAAACAVEQEWITEHIAEGLLPRPPGQTAEWRFTSRSLQRVQRMRSIERDFEAAPELAALVADLLEEVDVLRGQLLRAGLSGRGDEE